MSYHVLHLLTPGMYLKKERGRLVASFPDGKVHSLPIENVRAIISMARTVTYSERLLAALLEHEAVILFCNPYYQPVGWFLPMYRTIHADIHRHQYLAPAPWRERVWSKIMRTKVLGQNEVLKLLGQGQLLLPSVFTDSSGTRPVTFEEEARVSKAYFRAYFQLLRGGQEKRADKRSQAQANAGAYDLNHLLNYAYGVLGALLHRSLIVHGFITLVGIRHKARYRSYPLVYDVMEAFRPIMDKVVANYVREVLRAHDPDLIEDDKTPMKGLAKYLATHMEGLRVRKGSGSLRWIDALDFYVRSFQEALQYQNEAALWLPQFEDFLWSPSLEEAS